MLRRLAFAVVAVSALVAAPPASAVLQPGVHQIMNRQDPGYCLTVAGAFMDNGAPVENLPCNNDPNQRWEFVGGQLKVEHSGKCLSVQWRGNDYESQVVQDSCAEAVTWINEDVAQGWSRIRAATSPSGVEMCVDKARRSDVKMWRCWNPWWQQWQSLG